MWILFSLTALVLGTAFAVRHRLRAAWKGEDCQGNEGGQTFHYQYRELRNKNRVIRIEAALICPCAYSFECRRERSFDRFFKWLGLSVEVQSGDASFDQDVYVVADNRVMGEVLRQHAALRRAMRLALNAGAKWVRCGNGRLLVRFPVGGSDYDLKRAAMLRALRALRPAVPLLKMPRREPLESLRDPAFWNAALIAGLGIGLVITGLADGVRVHFTDAQLLRPLQLLAPALLFIAALWGGLLLLTVLLLRGTSRFHLALVEAVLIGGIGSGMTGLGAAHDWNIDFDTSQAQRIQTPIHDAWTEQRRRKRSTYTVYLFSVPPDASDRLEGKSKFEVDSRLHAELKRSRSVTITRRERRLGVAWVESIHTP